MKPDDDKGSWAFMMFLAREWARSENAQGKAPVYVSIALMFVGLSLAFYGSRTWGGVNDEAMATLFVVVTLGAFVAFVVANTEPTRKLAAGVMIGFWLGAIDGSRLWWGLTGVGIQALAFAIAVRAERRAPLQE